MATLRVLSTNANPICEFSHNFSLWFRPVVSTYVNIHVCSISEILSTSCSWLYLFRSLSVFLFKFFWLDVADHDKLTGPHHCSDWPLQAAAEQCLWAWPAVSALRCCWVKSCPVHAEAEWPVGSASPEALEAAASRSATHSVPSRTDPPVLRAFVPENCGKKERGN